MSTLVNKFGTFSVVPNSVIRRWPIIGLDAVALYLYLVYRTNSESEQAFPSYTTITADTTISRNRIAKALRALEADKLIERKRRFSQSTLYTLTPPIPISPVAGLQQSPISPVAGRSLVPQRDTNKTDSKKKKTLGAKVPRPRDDLFDAVVEVCQANQKLNGSTVGTVAAALKAAGYTAEDVRAFGRDWWGWKERTKAPTVWKLRDTISQVCSKKIAGQGAARGPVLPEGLLDG